MVRGQLDRSRKQGFSPGETREKESHLWGKQTEEQRGPGAREPGDKKRKEKYIIYTLERLNWVFHKERNLSLWPALFWATFY